MARYIESHWAWCEQIAWAVKASGSRDIDADLSARIALAKVHGGRLLELCAREAQQIFGGNAISKGGVGGRVEQIVRDMRVSIVGGGSEEVITDLSVRQEEQATQRKMKKLRASSKI